jgi:UDP-glucose 4-epimerase
MGHRVVVLDDLSGGALANVPPEAIFEQASICDQSTIDKLFRDYEFDYVFHLAAYAAEGLSHFIKRFNYLNNVVGSVNLINAAVNTATVRCFVFTSSIAVYGHVLAPPVTEHTPPAPADPYGIAKYAVEQELRISHELFGLPYIVFRPHNVYGERQNLGDRYRNVIGIFLNCALRHEPFPVFGDGEQTRAFSYIADVAPIIARSIEVPAAYQQVFNIGGDRAYTINELAARVAAVAGVALRVDYQPSRMEARHAIADHDRLRAVFGQVPQVELDEGLARMAAWARRHGPRQPSTFADIEIERQLPPSWRAAIEAARPPHSPAQ